MRMRITQLAAIALAALLGATSAKAIERRPLPAFRVVAPDGTVVSSSKIPVPDKWLLLYVAPGCQSCDRLLAAFKSWQSPQLVQRTVIIVGGQVASAQTYLQQALPPEVNTIPWFADAGNEAWLALRLTGTPVLIGVNKGITEWAISGVLNDPSTLESVVKSWVNQ